MSHADPIPLAKTRPDSSLVPVTEVAKIVRQCLKEAFPGYKFGVKSDQYANGASIHVRWFAGPTQAQVKSVVGHLASAYFDSSIDYRGSVYHLMDGKPVSLGADYIRLHPQFDDRIGRGVEPLPSKTAGRIFVSHDDGYSRLVGDGTSAVPIGPEA